MADTTFPSFHTAFPPDEDRIPYDPRRHDAFAGKVPASLVKEWRTVGFGSYGNGILWTPPPDSPFLATGDWPALDGTGIEVMRSAFADVCVLQGGEFRWLSVHSGRIVSYGDSVEGLFHGMTNKGIRNSFLLERLLRIAIDRLGNLGQEECFGFAPLPSLGGAIAEEYLVKAQMREYVTIAAQALG